MSDTVGGKIELADFDIFKCRTIVKGTIVTLSQIHIGSGTSSDIADNPVIRVNYNGSNIPYIPGSSLKGVVRAFLESVLSNVKNGNDVVSYLFGISENNFHVRGHLSFVDGLPLDHITTQIKPGVAIDRVLGSARARAKYSIETVAPGSKFSFKLIAENIDLRNKSLISKAVLLALKELKTGNISIGGKTSSGLGAIALKDIKIEILTSDSIKDLKMEYTDITNEVQL